MKALEYRPTEGSEAYRNHYPVIAPLVMCHGLGDGKTTSCVVAQAATIDALITAFVECSKITDGEAVKP